MKATWLNTEYEVLREIINKRIDCMNKYLESLYKLYDKENTEIYNLPWYKVIFKTTHDDTEEYVYATKLVRNIKWTKYEINDLKQLLSRINEISSSSYITLNEEDLELVFG